MFRKKFNVTLLNKNWETISHLKIGSIPCKDELIYLDSFSKYFSVLNVVRRFDINNRETLFIIIEELIKNT